MDQKPDFKNNKPSSPELPPRAGDNSESDASPLNASTRQNEQLSYLNILDSKVSLDAPPEYSANNPTVFTAIPKHDSAIYQSLPQQFNSNNNGNSVESSSLNRPILPFSAEPITAPTKLYEQQQDSAFCTYCAEKPGYFSALTSSRLWISTLFQFVSFIVGVAGLMVVATCFSLGIGLFILFPIGPVITWVCFVCIRLFGNLELLSLPLTYNASELCTNCNLNSIKHFSIPHLTRNQSTAGGRQGFYSKMVAPITDAYSWRCAVYFMFVKPFVSIASFMIAFTILVTGIIVFPLLPAVLRSINVFSYAQRTVAIAVLSPPPPQNQDPKAVSGLTMV